MNLLVNVHLWGWIDVTPRLWEGLFAISGLALVTLFLVDRSERWVVIPGLALLITAGVVSINTEFGSRVGTSYEIVRWAAPICMAAGAIVCWAYYIVNRVAWWALPLGSALLTLAAEITTAYLSPVLAGAVYCAGLLLTAWLFMLSRFPAEIHGPGKKQHTSSRS
jgi:hypothetical protein